MIVIKTPPDWRAGRGNIVKKFLVLALMTMGISSWADAQEDQGRAGRQAPPPGKVLYCGDNKVAISAADCGITIPDAPLLPYAPVAGPVLPAQMQRGGVAGVVLSKSGTLYSYERTSTPLVQWDKDGNFAHGYLQGTVKRAHGMRMDPDGVDIWLTDVNDNTVEKVSPDGKVLLTLGMSGQAGSWDEAKGVHLFTEPTDVGFGPKGDIFVATGHGGKDPRIIRFDKNGKFITSWSLQHPDGSIATIHTLVVNKNGEVYVGDRQIKIIRVFDVNGKHLRDFNTDNLICGLYIDPKGGLWMTAGRDGMIEKLDWSGKVLGRLGNHGLGPNEYGEAHYMTMTPDMKTIYVADSDNGVIHKLVATN
jgi:WD40 repeat protein